MEKLEIVNFAGIKTMTFDLKSINILIGPQGSGKSVTVKLFYFFKSIFPDIVKSINDEESKRDFDKSQVEKFLNFFPKETWPNDNFSITYTLNKTTVFVENVGNKLKISYSDNFKNLYLRCKNVYAKEKIKIGLESNSSNFKWWVELRRSVEKILEEEISPRSTDRQYFIPVGRSFFSIIQNSIFSFLSDNRSLDPFLIDFGANYEFFKNFYASSLKGESIDKQFKEISDEILDGSYLREKDKDYLIHKDSRRVNLSNASSGQQETFPLIVFLTVLNRMPFGEGATIYIEEPEAHLFPIAQKAIVQLLARTFNHDENKFQIIVTTHSPYILASFNNLLEAGRLTQLKPNKSKFVSKIVPLKEQLSPDTLTAYSLKNGKMETLIDKESQLITQTILDNVSNEIATEFGKLLDIEFSYE